MSKLEQNNMTCWLNHTYVDDKTMLVSSVPPGTRYRDGRVIIVDEEIENDKTIPSDKRTADVVRTMASDIFKGISFTADCPSSNTNGKMPVLDLQLWLEKGEDGINIVRFEFYKKPMASQVVLHKKSAVSWTTKRSSLVSEVYRRLYNCDKMVNWLD